MRPSSSSMAQRVKKTFISITGLLLYSNAFANVAPTAPSQVSIATSIGEEGVVISWSGATDPDGVVVGYELVKNGSVMWLGNVNSYRDVSVSHGVSYAYNIVAVDDHDLRSPLSDTVIYRFMTQSAQSNNGQTSYSGGSISTGSVLNNCVDDDGDGWGWDGSKSCRIEHFNNHTNHSNTFHNSCIDDDGDGWGWDGQQSCRVDGSASINSHSHNCVDDDGDGWGWDGNGSCRMHSAINSDGGPSTCIDEDGDGYGWDGYQTCNPSTH